MARFYFPFPPALLHRHGQISACLYQITEQSIGKAGTRVGTVLLHLGCRFQFRVGNSPWKWGKGIGGEATNSSWINEYFSSASSPSRSSLTTECVESHTRLSSVLKDCSCFYLQKLTNPVKASGLQGKKKIVEVVVLAGLMSPCLPIIP